MISHKHKFIFIHIPKTAGKSVDLTLTKSIGYFYLDPRYQKNRTLKTSSEANDNLAEKLWHYTANEMIDKFGNELWDEYASFTVVRNPWERLVSEYHWQGQTAGNWGNSDISFSDFCVSDYNWYPEIEKSHLMPQFSFIIDSEKTVRIDHIIRFENLQQDFNTVCDKIGIPQRQLSHKNESEHRHYTEYYDDETREITAKKYAKDIEYFGYEFGD